MKRSQKSVPNAMTGTVPTDDGYSSNKNPQGIGWKNKGGRNATTNEAKRGAGQVAPRPQTSRQPLVSASAHTAPTQGGMARVKDRPSSPTGKMPPAGSFTPVQNNAMANLMGQSVGQAEAAPRGNSSRISPQTRTHGNGNPVATNKPKRKGLGAAFWGEY